MLYFISYSCWHRGNLLRGNYQHDRQTPICNIRDIGEIEEKIEDELQKKDKDYRGVNICSWQRFEETLPEKEQLTNRFDNLEG